MIEEILLELGYNLKNENVKFWRCKPIYRESGNKTSLRINKITGRFIDFSANVSGTFDELVKLSLKLSSIDEARKWLGNKDYNPSIEKEKPKILRPFSVEPDYPSTLNRHYYYFNNRGISKEILDEFECGVDMSGKMNNRFVFVIRDEFDDICGLVGRDLLSRDTKWKIMGYKKEWIFPKLKADPKSMILVESIGDMLALREAGIYNVLVLFGVSISSVMVNHLATLDLREIIISTNNDDTKIKNWGSNAAKSISKKLSKIIDKTKIKIVLPPSGDWGETKISTIQKIFL